jgi:hypothetical protein
MLTCEGIGWGSLNVSKQYSAPPGTPQDAHQVGDEHGEVLEGGHDDEHHLQRNVEGEHLRVIAPPSAMERAHVNGHANTAHQITEYH